MVLPAMFAACTAEEIVENVIYALDPCEIEDNMVSIILKKNVADALLGTKHGDNVVSGIRRAKNSIKQLVIPGMFFEDMGITYLGPVDGHNIKAMVRVIGEAKRVKGPVLVHVITQKGKGYAPAERHPARFHGAEPFDPETGLPRKPRTTANYTDVFSTVMTKLGSRDEKVVAITAAMPDGTGLKRFRNMYPDRFFDVGIAEEHAVTFAAGIASIREALSAAANSSSSILRILIPLMIPLTRLMIAMIPNVIIPKIMVLTPRLTSLTKKLGTPIWLKIMFIMPKTILLSIVKNLLSKI